MLYILWCNSSIIYTRKGKTNIPLVNNTSYPTDSFSVSNATVFWQGFYHDWSYNHRINRIGDWIQSVAENDNGIRAIFSHSGATGSGSDVLSYLSYFTYLKTDKAKFFSSSVNTAIRGREATTTTKIITVKGKWPAALKNYNKGIIVLNGFDMYCSSSDNGKIMGTGSADKLSDFFIEVDKLRINGEEFEFDLTVKLGADCDSPECLNFSPGDNEWFDYQLNVAYQVIAYNDGVHNTKKELSQNYSWRKPFKTRPDIDPNEIFRRDKEFKDLKIQGISGYLVGIPLLNKIEINLPKGKGGLVRKRMETPHLLSLDVAITDFTYNTSTGLCVYDADLFFKNWKTNMHPLAYGNDGKASISVGVNLLQINDANAKVEVQSVKGNINWQTTQLEQRQADDPNAVKSFVFVR
jgi:hypothetical protein